MVHKKSLNGSPENGHNILNTSKKSALFYFKSPHAEWFLKNLEKIHPLCRLCNKYSINAY